MTLRELAWAADGRQRAEWGRAASMTAAAAAAWSGERIDPNDLLPGRYRRPAADRPEPDETGSALRLLEAGLSRMG